MDETQITAPAEDVMLATASSPVSYERPGPIRRAGAGAWHALAGVAFLLRSVGSLWPYALAPAVLTALFLVGGLFVGAFLLNAVESRFIPDGVFATSGILLSIRVGLWITTLAAATLAGLALALFLSAPILDRLSRRVEQLIHAKAGTRPRSLRQELIQSFRGSVYMLGAAPLALLVGLIPFIGPPIAAGLCSFALAFQQTDPILTRRDLSFATRRYWHHQWRWESIGFGAAGLLLLPFVNVLIGPVLTIGATLLVLELKDGFVP